MRRISKKKRLKEAERQEREAEQAETLATRKEQKAAEELKQRQDQAEAAFKEACDLMSQQGKSACAADAAAAAEKSSHSFLPEFFLESENYARIVTDLVNQLFDDISALPDRYRSLGLTKPVLTALQQSGQTLALNYLGVSGLNSGISTLSKRSKQEKHTLSNLNPRLFQDEREKKITAASQSQEKREEMRANLVSRPNPTIRQADLSHLRDPCSLLESTPFSNMSNLVTVLDPHSNNTLPQRLSFFYSLIALTNESEKDNLSESMKKAMIRIALANPEERSTFKEKINNLFSELIKSDYCKKSRIGTKITDNDYETLKSYITWMQSIIDFTYDTFILKLEELFVILVSSQTINLLAHARNENPKYQTNKDIYKALKELLLPRSELEKEEEEGEAEAAEAAAEADSIPTFRA